MWRPGSKLVHPFNPELGVGLVRSIEGRFLTVYFPAAEREITMAAEGRVQRFSKHRHPKRYLQGLDTGDWRAETRYLSEQELVFEFFLNQLRLKQGVSIEDFQARTGLPWTIVESRVQNAVDRDLLTLQHGRVSTTSLGWRFVNDIQQMFLP